MLSSTWRIINKAQEKYNINVKNIKKFDKYMFVNCVCLRARERERELLRCWEFFSLHLCCLI
jgi:hypothetical protein